MTLTKEEILTLINVLEQVAPAKLSDARVLIAISDKLKLMRERIDKEPAA